MTKKREQWRLPKEFKPDPLVGDTRQRYDGEPIIRELIKHGNDHTLTADLFNSCCGCDLMHLRTFNVFKTKDGKWYLLYRSYGVPGTGPQEPKEEKDE